MAKKEPLIVKVTDTTGQMRVTIPSGKGIKKGDYVNIEKIEA